MQKNCLLNTVLTVLDDLKAINIIPLNVTNLTTITDYMVVATGNSSRHVRAIAQNLIDKAEELNILPLGMESDDNNEWTLVDFGDIVVHIMQPQARDFYQLEKLWSSSNVKEPELEMV